MNSTVPAARRTSPVLVALLALLCCLLNARPAAAVGTISGQVTASCPSSTGLLGVTVDAFAAGTDDLVASATTNGMGNYSFPSLPDGDYTVSILTPLGYSAAAADLPATVTNEQTTSVNFGLTCVAASGTPRVAGFWKHQVGVATGGNGAASVSTSSLCGYLDAVKAHFNENALNQVVVYDVGASASCVEKLEGAKPLINATPSGLTQGWGATGTATGQFQNPTGLALDASGRVYVVDNDNQRVQVFTSGGDFVRTWGSAGSGPGQFHFSYLSGNLAVDGSGNVFVGDGRLQKFASDGTFLQQVGGVQDPVWGDFVSTTGLAVTAAGDIYVGDSFQRRVLKFTNNLALAHNYYGSQPFYLTPSVEGIAIDANGDIFFVDSGYWPPFFGAGIYKMTDAGQLLNHFAVNPFIGEPNNIYGAHGIAIDASGKMYVAEAWNNRVQVFNPDGSYYGQWGTLGTAYGQFNAPTWIVIDGSGNIYVSDSGNNRIQKFGPGGSLIKLNGPAAPVDRARQHLLALLLNVAANYLRLTDVISKDGATVSQAITYCDQLIDSPTGDDELAASIADKINSGQKVNSGVIPLGTQQIAYARGTQLVEFRAGQNPGSGPRPLRFTLKAPGHVDLAVFDVSGRKVAQVFSGSLAEGPHSIAWSGANDRGAPVGRGIYFAKLDAGPESRVARLVQVAP